MRGTSLALIGILGITAAGCPKPPEGPTKTESPCNRAGIAVSVYVDVEGGKATTANKTIYLCKNKDWVEWAASTGDLQDPNFGLNSPFEGPFAHDKKKIKSDKPKKKGHFDYTMKVVVDGTPIDIDPSVEVME